MSIDGTLQIVDGLTKLIGVLIWPATLLFIVVRFRSAFGDFLGNLGELSFKGGGIEASAKRRQTEAAAALGAATVAHTDQTLSPESIAQGARASADLVTQVVTPRALRQTTQSRILWVDDRPENNIHERQALEAVGIEIVLATSTEEALDRIRHQHFDAIISDMGRPPDGKAGYTLLDSLRQAGNRTPYVIYAGSRAAQHMEEARRRGALGSTNRPDELFRWVVSAVQANRG